MLLKQQSMTGGVCRRVLSSFFCIKLFYMKKATLTLTLLTAITAAGIIAACNGSHANNPETDPARPEYTTAQVAHGKYLVTIMGCNDCHTPLKMGPHGPERDTSRLLSGHPEALPLPPLDTAAQKHWLLFDYTMTSAAGPWGVSFTANLTSDSATGLGNWTLARFKKALIEGKSKGLDNNRTLLPPMPWTNYRNITDEDITDIFAYLKSTKPVKNLVPSALPPMAFK